MINNMNNLGMNFIGMNNMNNIGANNIGINNFGMINNMGMNNNGINNMGINQMNMHNQSNLMDENALRIKNLIQPYENKIKELEEIIRQKDFEIAVLKDKINNNNFNIQNPNLMNMNPMNMMMQVPNKEIEKGKEIVVYRMNSFKEMLPGKYICYENEMTFKLLDRMIGNYPWNLLKFLCNEKTLHPFLTIKENGIKDGSIINYCRALNILFKNNIGSSIIIALDDNYPIKKAIKFYLLKIGKEGCFNKFFFLYNYTRLNIKDKTPIKNIFKYDPNPTIIVQQLF